MYRVRASGWFVRIVHNMNMYFDKRMLNCRLFIGHCDSSCHLSTVGINFVTQVYYYISLRTHLIAAVISIEL